MDLTEALAHAELFANIGMGIERLFIIAFLSFCFYQYYKSKRK